MNDQVCSRLPGTQGCTLGLKGVGKNSLVREIIYTYACKGSRACRESCPMPFHNRRTMKNETAGRLIREICGRAAEEGYEKVHIELTGGDILAVRDRAEGLVEELKNIRSDIPVTYGLTVCGREFTTDEKKWIAENRSYFSIRYRWNGRTGAKAWDKDKIFWNETADTVLWSVTRDSLPDLKEEIEFLVGTGKEIRFEFAGIDKWTETDCLYYAEAIGGLEKHAVGTVLGGDAAEEYGYTGQNSCGRIDITDTDGTVFGCQYLSPMRMSYSERQRAGENARRKIKKCEKCPAGIEEPCILCAAEKMMVSKTPVSVQCLLHRVHKEKLRQTEEISR